jgi:hypothetical protein
MVIASGSFTGPDIIARMHTGAEAGYGFSSRAHDHVSARIEASASVSR